MQAKLLRVLQEREFQRVGGTKTIKADLPLLANYFAQKHASNAKRTVVGISTQARACLMSYGWPGNVRELENAIERAVVLGATETVLMEDLPETLAETERPAGESCDGFHAAVREAKKQNVLQALQQAGGSYVEAATLLGLHPSNLHRLIRNLNLRAEPK